MSRVSLTEFDGRRKRQAHLFVNVLALAAEARGAVTHGGAARARHRKRDVDGRSQAKGGEVSASNRPLNGAFS